MLGGPLGLSSPERVERHIELALEPVLGVVRRLAVPPQNDPQQARVTAAGVAAAARRAL